MNKLYFLNKVIDLNSQVYLSESNTVCVKTNTGNKQLLIEKIEIISTLLEQFGHKLNQTNPNGLKIFFSRLLHHCENRKDLKTIVGNLFERVVLNKTTFLEFNSPFNFLIQISPPPIDADELGNNLLQILEKFPRYQLGNQLEVYDVHYNTYPKFWNRSIIFDNLTIQFEQYVKEMTNLTQVKVLTDITNEVKNLYKPQVFVHLGIALETSPEESANLSMWSTCHPFIENKKPVIVNRELLRIQGLRFKIKTKISECDVYCQKEGTLCLIIPKGQSPESLGFNSKCLELWTRPLTSIIPLREKKNRTYLQNLFLEEGDVKFVRLVSLSGHGTYKNPNDSQKGSIIGMDFIQFQKMLKVLYENNTAIVVLTSCYAGGQNSNEIHLPGETIPFPIFIEGSFESTIKAEILGSSNLRFLEKAQSLIFPKKSNQSIPRQLQRRDCETLANCLNSNHHLCNTPSYILPSNNNASIPKVIYCAHDETQIFDVNSSLDDLKKRSDVVEPINLHSPVKAVLFTKSEVNGNLCITHPEAFIISRGGKSQHVLKKLELRNQSFEQFLERTFTLMPIKTNKSYYISEVVNIFGGNCTIFEKVLINNFHDEKEVFFKSNSEKQFYRMKYHKVNKCWIKMPVLKSLSATSAHYQFYFSAFESRPLPTTLVQSTGGRQDHCDFIYSLRELFWGGQLPWDAAIYEATILQKKIFVKHDFQTSHIKVGYAVSQLIENLPSLQDLTQSEVTVIKNAIDLASLSGNRVLGDLIRRAKSPRLMQALKENSVELLKSLLLENPKLLNEVDVNGNTALMIAASDGQTELAKFLLAEGADYKICNRRKANAFIFAIHSNNLELAGLLLEKGIDLSDEENLYAFTLVLEKKNNAALFLIKNQVGRNTHKPLFAMVAKSSQRLELFKALAQYALVTINYCYESKGKTALHLSLEAGDLEAVEFLLSHGADANLKDSADSTPLEMALEYGKDNANAMVKLLVSHGADVHAKNTEGETPLLFAIFHQQAESATLLLQNSTQLVRELKKISPLELCVENPDMLTALKKSEKFDINVPNLEGFSVLGTAILENDLEAIEFWLSQGADLQKCSVNTPLLTAYFKHHDYKIVDCDFAVKDADPVILKKLIEWKFDVNAVNAEDETPLFLAAHQGIEIIKILLDAQADPNYRNKKCHWLPLTKSCLGSLDVMELLYDKTFHKSVSDFSIMIWMMLSSIRRDNARKFIDLLLRKCIEIENPDLGNAIFNKDIAQTSALMSQAENFHGLTLASLFKFPLISWAICFGEENSHAIISRLLEYKLDINEKDFYNKTPLHWAILFNKVSIVNLLIELGAKLDGADLLGSSPIEYATGNLEILNVLHSKNVDFKGAIGDLLHAKALKVKCQVTLDFLTGVGRL